MLISFALIVSLGLLAGFVSKKIGLPALLGMLAVGIATGPSGFDLVSPQLLAIAPDLRMVALVIILTRAGLALNLAELKQVGRPALLLCCVPAICEIIAITILGHLFLGLTILEAAIVGSVLAAVSPAVVVPRMLKLMAENRGKKQGIPQMIMAAASVDDVFVIVIFTALITMAQGGAVDTISFIKVPISILVGASFGFGLGGVLAYYFKKFHIRDSAKVMILLCVAFSIIELEKILPIPMSGLLAIMFIGIGIFKFHSDLAVRLSKKFEKLWVLAEIILFVLVGTSVDIKYALSAGLLILLVIVGGLVGRMFGTGVSVQKSSLNRKEQLFCMLAYLPKATVQAAIGAVPLALGLDCGKTVLTAAVIAIILTAPLGALAIDKSYKKLLSDK